MRFSMTLGRRLVVTVYERTTLLQALKEQGLVWIEGEGLLDTILTSMAPTSIIQSSKQYRFAPSQSELFYNWVYNLGLEDALFYTGFSHLGSRLDTETFQTIYPQFNMDSYLENSPSTTNRVSLEQVLKILSQFSWHQIVYVAFE